MPIRLDTILFVLLCILFTTLVQSVGRPSTAQENGSAVEGNLDGNWWRDDFMYVGPNEWKPFDEWSRNAPAGRQDAVATILVDSSRHKLVLYGGNGYAQDNATWIYSPHTNSWQAVVLSVRPKAQAFHTMVTLCGETVILWR